MLPEANYVGNPGKTLTPHDRFLNSACPCRCSRQESHMQTPALHSDESARLDALRDLRILDTPTEERFDRIARLAQFIFGTPMALITLVDEKRQWFKARVGLDLTESNREISFCGHAILQNQTFFIPDTAVDQRFNDNPLVTGNPHIRMYAGHPIHAANGMPVGTVCVLDTVPRSVEPGMLSALADLAAIAESEMNGIQLQQLARTLNDEKASLESKHAQATKLNQILEKLTLLDPTSHIPNPLYLRIYLSQELIRCRQQRKPLSLLCIEIDGLIELRRLRGDEVAREIVRRTTPVITDIPKWPRGMTFQVDPYHLAIVLPEKDSDGALTVARECQSRLRALKLVMPGRGEAVTCSIGQITASSPSATVDSLLLQLESTTKIAQESGPERIRQLTV